MDPSGFIGVTSAVAAPLKILAFMIFPLIVHWAILPKHGLRNNVSAVHGSGFHSVLRRRGLGDKALDVYKRQPTTLSTQTPDKNPTENPNENNSLTNPVNDSSKSEDSASSTSSETQNRPNDSEARISIVLEMDDLLLKQKPKRVLVSLIGKDASGAVSVRRIPLPLDGQTLKLSLKPGTYRIYKEPAFGLQIKTMVLAQESPETSSLPEKTGSGQSLDLSAGRCV